MSEAAYMKRDGHRLLKVDDCAWEGFSRIGTWVGTLRHSRGGLAAPVVGCSADLGVCMPAI